MLDVGDGADLIFGFVEVEGIFKLVLELIVHRKGMALRRFARGIQFQEFIGHVLHRFFDAGLGARPLLRSQLVQNGRGAALRGAIFLDQIQSRQRNI